MSKAPATEARKPRRRPGELYVTHEFSGSDPDALVKCYVQIIRDQRRKRAEQESREDTTNKIPVHA